MFCPNCGQELKPGGKFCPNCGKALPVMPEASQPAEPVAQPEPEAPQQSTVTQQAAPQQPVPQPVMQQSAAAVYTQQPIARTQQTTVAAVAQYQKPADYRNLGIFVLLEFVTLGIYYLYNIVRFTEVTNKDEKYARRSPVGWLILSIFFWPAHWWWFYKTGKILDDMYYKKTGQETSMAALGLILVIFQLGFIAMVIFQDRLNKVVGGATGTAPESHGVGTCSNCGATFPDDARNCPQCGTAYKRPFSHTNIFPFVIMLLGFVVFILLIVLIAAAV